MASIVSRSSVSEVTLVMVIKLNILVGSCFCIFLIIATNFNLYDFKLKKIWFSYHFAHVYNHLIRFPSHIQRGEFLLKNMSLV